MMEDEDVGRASMQGGGRATGVCTGLCTACVSPGLARERAAKTPHQTSRALQCAGCPAVVRVVRSESHLAFAFSRTQ